MTTCVGSHGGFKLTFALVAAIANGGFTLFIFLLSLPAMATSGRSWLKLIVYLIVVDALFTMVIGLYLWVLTLTTKQELFDIWIKQPASTQTLLQTTVSQDCSGNSNKRSEILTCTQFQCCGYFNSTAPAFVTDATCPSPATAALIKGCAAPLTSFSNVFIDNIFTAAFGMVGIDVALVMSIACLLKDRKERERFRHIDEKRGTF